MDSAVSRSLLLLAGLSMVASLGCGGKKTTEPRHCGNGLVEPGEVCDDGEANGDDWALSQRCLSGCSGPAPYCGDGNLDAQETCDDGEANGDDWALSQHCLSGCSGPAPYCGDGNLDAQETCDDGEANGDDWALSQHCLSDCSGLAPYCGDGNPDAQETCDNGEANGDDWALSQHCLSDCSGLAPYCGDGNLDAPEECDDENSDSIDDCSIDCQLDPAEVGPHEVDRVSFDDWVDTTRGREVPTDVVYPLGLSSDDKPVPLVVFSHGWGANRTSYDYLIEHLASHGYVVLVPQHVGSDSLLKPIDDQETVDRALDVRFVIDRAESLNLGDSPELDGLINMDAIAVAGHSYGACTALAAGGALIPATDQNGFVPAAYDDARVDVIAALSPQGPYDEVDAPRHFFNEQSYQPLTLPAMVLTGSEDQASGVTDAPAWRREAYERMPAGDKYLVFIEGATHLFFSDSPACSSLVDANLRQACENTKRYSQAMITALLDFYLSDRETGDGYLSSAYATRLSGTEIEFDSK